MQADLRAALFAANVDFHDDLIRNIPAVRQPQNLFDDLSPDPADWDLAVAAAGAGGTPDEDTAVHPSFDPGSVIGYSFDPAHWQATRFSDGSAWGVWYGSREVETTVCETAWHWARFVLDSYAGQEREIVSERRLFAVRCDALLIDLCGRQIAYPDLVSRTSYAFTQQLGRYVHEQALNGLLVPSARCTGVNAAIFRPERLSDIRDRGFLIYRLDVVRDTFVAERTPGRRWTSLVPSSLG